MIGFFYLLDRISWNRLNSRVVSECLLTWRVWLLTLTCRNSIYYERNSITDHGDH